MLIYYWPFFYYYSVSYFFPESRDAIKSPKQETLVSSLREPSYEERLKELQLPTLTERRDRGDMLLLYKYVLKELRRYM